MNDIFQYILTACIVIVPIIIWGYTFSIHGTNISPKIMRKFFILGILSAIIILGIRMIGREWGYDIFNYDIQKTSVMVLQEIGVLIGIGLLIYGWKIRSGKQIQSWIGLIIGVCMLAYFGNIFASGMTILSIFLLALIEEFTKGLASINKYNMLPIIGIYSALGFVFFENILYIKEYPEFSVFFGRSVISLLLHVSSTFVLLLGIHIAIQKNITPIFGAIFAITIASILHTTYNVSLHFGSIGLLLTLILTIMSYMMVTYFIQRFSRDLDEFDLQEPIYSSQAPQ